MDPTPRHMSAARLAELRAIQARSQNPYDPYEDETFGLMAESVPELLDEVSRLRARVEVTDEDIRAAGLGDPDVCAKCPRLVAWCFANGLHVVDSTNDTLGLPLEQGMWRHGIWSRRPSWEGSQPEGPPAETIHHGSPMAHDHIINAVARRVGRAPLDVLDEIAATGDGSDEHDITTIDQLDQFVGRWVQLGFHSWTHCNDPLTWKGSGTLGRDDSWLTIDGVRQANYPDNSERRTPVVRIRLLDSGEVSDG